MDAQRTLTAWRRATWVALVASTAALVVATSTYVGMPHIRVKLVEAPMDVANHRIAVAVTDPLADQLSAPWALIARVRRAGREPTSFDISLDGQRACTALIAPNRATRIDCAGVWQRLGGPHEITVTGTGVWALEYLEVATHHGNTTGPLESYIVPAGASGFARPSPVWAIVAFAAVVVIGLLRPASARPGVIRVAALVVGALAVLVLTLVAAAPFVSSFRVVVSAWTLVEWVAGIAILRWWPAPSTWRVVIALATRLAAFARQVTVPQAAGVITMGVFLLAVILGTRAAGAADTYGYVSEADLWLRGDLRIPQPFAAEAPWPNADRAFAPLGYQPSAVDRRMIVPTYAPGLPMLFALAKLVGGHTAMYFVVPTFTAVLVLNTFGLGRRLGSDVAGLIGMCLVATSPVVVWHALLAMTDVPVAAAWAVAFYAALGPLRVRNAVWAGLAAGLAVLIRPNLVPLTAALGLHYVIRLWPPAERRRALVCGLAYGVAIVPAVAIVAAINWWLYGSPLTSGYGAAGELLTGAHMGENARNYLTWMVESHSPTILVGIVALAVPARWIWPQAPDRRVFLVIGTFVASLWAIYCAWLVFDSWLYLRFLVSAWPFIMIGVGAVAAACMALPMRGARPAAIGAVAVLVLFQLRFGDRWDALNVGWDEDRNVAIAGLVRQLTPPNSVIISLHHSGTLRYYGGRMTIFYPQLDTASLDRAVDWLSERNVRTYALLEGWEISDFRARFASQLRTGMVNERPVAEYHEPGHAFLFDLTGPRSPSRAPVITRGASHSWLAPPPVPLDPLDLGPRERAKSHRGVVRLRSASAALARLTHPRARRDR